MSVFGKKKKERKKNSQIESRVLFEMSPGPRLLLLTDIRASGSYHYLFPISYARTQKFELKKWWDQRTTWTNSDFRSVALSRVDCRIVQESWARHHGTSIAFRAESSHWLQPKGPGTSSKFHAQGTAVTGIYYLLLCLRLNGRNQDDGEESWLDFQMLHVPCGSIPEGSIRYLFLFFSFPCRFSK